MSKWLTELTSMRNNHFPALRILQLTLLYTVLTIILHTVLYTTLYFVLYIVLYSVLQPETAWFPEEHFFLPVFSKLFLTILLYSGLYTEHYSVYSTVNNTLQNILSVQYLPCLLTNVLLNLHFTDLYTIMYIMYIMYIIMFTVFVLGQDEEGVPDGEAQENS